MRDDASWWRVLLARARALVRPQRVHDEIDDELTFHLEMRAKELARQGMSDADARRAAALAFGSVAHIKELSYDVRGGGWLEAVWRDVTYAARSLANQRALSAVVIGVVALGIGASAAILGVADRVLWRELPVRAPGELQELRPAGDLEGFSYPLYEALRGEAGPFSGVFARWRQTSTFERGGAPERAVVELVSGNYFNVLGVQPAVGRLLSDDDDRTVMSHPVAVVSDRYWRTRFGAEPSAIGRTIRIDDYPFTIVGVAPPEFFGVEVGAEPDAWVPLAMHPVLFDAHRSLVDDNWMWLDVIGRLPAGSSTVAAAAHASLVATRFRESTGERKNSLVSGAIELRAANRGLPRLRGGMTIPLTVLVGLIGFVLVVACANVATLVLVRTTARSRETGVRLALGASRWRVMRQLLIENLMLASAGGVVGTALAVGASRALVRFLLPSVDAGAIDVTPDPRLLIISLALTTITGALFGVAPAIRAARLDVASIINGAVRPRRRAPWTLGIRPALVAGQVAVSLVLVIAAGLFAKSLQRLAVAPQGYDAGHVLMATISPTLNRYTPESALAFYDALETRLSGAPGVRAVGTSAVPLLGGQSNIITMRVPDRFRRLDPLLLLMHTVSGDFFGATGVRILRGRAFDARDAGQGATPLVLNETAAKAYFGDEDPVGRSVRLMGQPATVIGLARDSKYRTVREAMPQIVYTRFGRSEFTVGLERTIYVRTEGEPAAFAPTLAAVVRDLDRALPVYDVRTLSEQRRRSMATERVVAWLSGLAAGVALLLASIGLYGLVAFDAQLRTREIGVRISLGATPSGIIALMLRGALALLVAGTIVGLALSVALGKLVSAQLYDVSPRDVSVAAAACAVLAAAAFIAAALPARRAARSSPLESLRCE